MQILESCRKAAVGSEEKPFKDALGFILSSRFIRLKPDDQHAFQVIVGSGMGLLSSDEVSSCTFFLMVEKWVRSPAVMQAFGMKLF